MTRIKRLLTPLVLIVAAVIAFTGVQAVAPAGTALAPKSASACSPSGGRPDERSEYCARHYMTQDYDGVLMCHNWSSTSCGTTSGNREWIYAGGGGHNDQTLSDYNWHDTDGFHVPPGWRVATNIVGWPDGWNRWKKLGWRKHSGCFGCLTNINRYPH